MRPKDYQKLLARGCPWCGESLVVKRGKYGEFIACSERCGYTKSIPGRSEFPPPKPAQRCPYKQCDGSGLLPVKTIPHAYRHCDCHPQYGTMAREHWSDTQPGDFDFPMSGTYREWTCSGLPDPGSNEMPVAREETEVIEPPQVRRRLSYQVEQARAEVLHLRTKLAEHLAQRRKPRGKY